MKQKMFNTRHFVLLVVLFDHNVPLHSMCKCDVINCDTNCRKSVIPDITSKMRLAFNVVKGRYLRGLPSDYKAQLMCTCVYMKSHGKRVGYDLLSGCVCAVVFA